MRWVRLWTLRGEYLGQYERAEVVRNPDDFLETRTALPDPLRDLLAEFSRADWQMQGNLDGLVAF